MASREGNGLGLKLLCLALAAFLWWVVFRSGSREVEIGLSVPVELSNVPSDLSVSRRPRDAVEVRVRGPRRVVARVPEMELVLPLDLSRAREGETTFRLRPADLRLPERAEVVRITPSALPVTLEKVVTARLPVRVPAKGEPAGGFAVAEVLAEPPLVEVRGPRSEVAGVRQLSTSPIDVSGAVGNVTSEVEVLLPGERVRMADPGERVRATAVVRARKGS